jgi:twitching motility protein PilT
MEVPQHVLSFAHALRGMLRQDPDVIMVGELRDLETIETALHAAQTGHLVYGTLHTNSAADTVLRIIGMFPEEKQNEVKLALGSSLLAVMSQQLLEKADGSGRVLAYELLLRDSALPNLINKSNAAQLYSYIQTGGNTGMRTLDMTLARLVAEKTIKRAVAMPYVKDKADFDQLVRRHQRDDEDDD